MSGAQSISTRRAYGVQRVCRVWARPRSSVYARRQGCFRHQLLLPRPYLVLTKPLRLDIQCQRGASANREDG